MTKKYRFTSNSEPTEEQLHFIMQEVIKDVKAKSEKADRLFFEKLNQLVIESKKQESIVK